AQYFAEQPVQHPAPGESHQFVSYAILAEIKMEINRVAEHTYKVSMFHYTHKMRKKSRVGTRWQVSSNIFHSQALYAIIATNSEGSGTPRGCFIFEKEGGGAYEAT